MKQPNRQSWIKQKKQFGDAFGGSGKGKTDKAGNQGDPGGDPDAKNLEGISTGAGNVGGGLSGRGVQYKPTIQDKSQKTGTVVVNVCVDRNGTVTKANFTQRGSTTNDSELIRIAETNAKKFKFSSSSVDEQCGTITFTFKVQ
jgi:TonB family protein